MKYQIKRLRNLLFSFIAISLFVTSAVFATELYKPEPEFVLEGDKAKPWAFIERHSDPHPRFPTEPFHPKLGQFYPQVVETFGEREPHSRKFLLHAMPGWDTSTKPYPVILLPGANDDASRRYAYPHSTSHPEHLTKTGLGVHLAEQGFSVFAISFSHFHGCNVHQGEQVANAITRIRKLLGREDDESFKVDLITYSKGAMAARCYVQSANDFVGLNYLTDYRGDVRRVVFQVGPIGGLDTMFRYYMYNLFCQSKDIPAPVGVSSQMLYGLWKDSGILNIHSGYWQGQLQMVSDTREVGVPYGPMSWTTDANMTMSAIRDGGSSFIAKGDGLEAARQAGGCMIENLNQRGFPKEVSAALVAGKHPILYHEEIHTWKVPIGAELSDQSDGLVFLKSATYKEGLTAQGAKVVDVNIFNLNHVQCSRETKVFEHVGNVLDMP